MNKLLLISLLLIAFNGQCFSQDGKISLALSHPLPMGENFLADNYKGLLDLGLKYRFVHAKVLQMGLSVNAGLYEANTINTVSVDVFMWAVQPRLYASLNLPVTNLHPSVGIGYSFLNFDTTSANDIFPEVNYNDTRQGLNLNATLSYDFFRFLFVTAQYDLIFLKKKDDILDIDYNNNLGILKFGLGVRF